MAGASDRLPVSVLTGFLGSGKTTLLSRLVRDPQMAKAAVIINEFGEVGLDHLLVEKADENTVLMESGCLCCTMRSDIIDTLRDLDSRRARGEVTEFDRIVIETTGLADPAPILHTLMTDPLVTGRFRLAGVAATIDSTAVLAQLERHEECVKQAAMADRLIITKTDLSDPQTQAKVRETLRRLNPGAEQIDARSDEFSPSALFEIGPYRADARAAEVARWMDAGDEHTAAHNHLHDHGFSSFAITIEAPVPLDALLRFFERLASTEGEDLLRMKAIVHAIESDRPIVVHGVQHIVYPPTQLKSWPPGDRRTQMVFITQGLSEARVRRLLERTLGH